MKKNFLILPFLIQCLFNLTKAQSGDNDDEQSEGFSPYSIVIIVVIATACIAGRRYYRKYKNRNNPNYGRESSQNRCTATLAAIFPCLKPKERHSSENQEDNPRSNRRRRRSEDAGQPDQYVPNRRASLQNQRRLSLQNGVPIILNNQAQPIQINNGRPPAAPQQHRNHEQQAEDEINVQEDNANPNGIAVPQPNNHHAMLQLQGNGHGVRQEEVILNINQQQQQQQPPLNQRRNGHQQQQQQQPQQPDLVEPADMVCPICKKNERNTYFMPCKHIAACKSCAKKIMAISKSCPECRSKVKKYHMYTKKIEKKPSMKRDESIREDLLCVICMDKKKDCGFLPCEHFCACKRCAQDIWKTSGKCPMCRKNIKGLSR